ncbi:MAG: DUF5106 domain-containing protein [Bacteroidales bacterium]|nr:DUF5106 domain-containing protein [Bacteroidales bacterium]
MVKSLIYRLLIIGFLGIAPLIITAIEPVQSGVREISLTIHLRGVYSSKISLMTQKKGSPLIQDILVKDNVNNGDTCVFIVPAEYLPGEFVLRFDYKEEMTSTPYPSEKSFILNRQDMELWVSPVFCNNADSTRWQDGELENAALHEFMAENYRQKEMLGLLQNYLMNYDDNTSGFYRMGITEYEKRRNAHNEWIAGQVKRHRDLFVSSLFFFQYVPEVSWEGDEADRRQSFKDHYFDFVDFNDTLLIRARDFKSWMDQYVNLYGEDATTTAKLDSLFTAAGKRAVEKAKTGHPRIYGWMVDYFYNGYESFNIQPGIEMLAAYLDDPNCLTAKRQAILKRVEGMKTLVEGSLAPDFQLTDNSGNQTSFHDFKANTPYKLVLFWSADCPHCMELVNKLYTFWQKPGSREMLSIFAISLDETETEIAEYEKAIRLLPGWNHHLAQGGVNSAEASSYFILATPVMVLTGADNKIVSMPESVEKLQQELK